MPPKRKQPLQKPPRPKRSCSARGNRNIFSSSESSLEFNVTGVTSQRVPAPRPSTSFAVTPPRQHEMTLSDLSNEFREVTNRIEARLNRLEPPANLLRFSTFETESERANIRFESPVSSQAPVTRPRRRQARPIVRPLTGDREPTTVDMPSPRRDADVITNREQRSPTPTCTRETPGTPPADIVARLLQAAVPALNSNKGKLKNFLPHKFVLRGDSCLKIGQGDSTMPEHFDAIFRMRNDDDCPVDWSEHLINHLAELSEMATLWDWPTCRRWSEKVFRLIAEGKLKGGWSNTAKLTDMQRNITSLCAKASAMDAQRFNSRRTTPSATQSVPTTTQNTTQHHNKDYQRDRDGKPCHSWNWGKDCGFTASHGVLPDASPHICAWCAYRYHRMNIHQEKECINKRKFLEKKSNENAQDFQ